MLAVIVTIVILGVIGALFAGGKGFFDSIGKGCGCVIVIIIFIVAVAVAMNL